MTMIEAPQFLRSSAERLFDWLSSEALPLWSTLGVDQNHGGFVEQLSPDGVPISDVRRARLVARQIFAFKTAGDLGWGGPADKLVQHGLAALFEHHITAEGQVRPRYWPADGTTEDRFDLYDHAFVLFALAHAHAHTDDAQLETRAQAIAKKMRANWGHVRGGFVEHQPPQAPLKSNPHMHLFEASLAWMAVSTDASWRQLAAEVADLCVSRFVDQQGSLHEYFDLDWNFVSDLGADIVEPGHQTEWAWLLLRWSAIQPRRQYETVARRLLAVAEGPGLNCTQGRLVNELSPQWTVRDGRMRLWPQTERIKALIAFHRIETQPDRRRELLEALEQATVALVGYFDHPISGSWWEHFDRDGTPIVEPARASSLYHIMGAAAELAHFVGLRLN